VDRSSYKCEVGNERRGGRVGTEVGEEEEEKGEKREVLSSLPLIHCAVL
jgi:hypothetical protein